MAQQPEPARAVPLDADGRADRTEALTALADAAAAAAPRVPDGALELARACWPSRLPLPGRGEHRALWSGARHRRGGRPLRGPGPRAPPRRRSRSWPRPACPDPDGDLGRVRRGGARRPCPGPARGRTAGSSSGTKPWCSLAGDLDPRPRDRVGRRRATAACSPSTCAHAGVASRRDELARPRPAPASSAGQHQLRRTSRATAVGAPGWYLQRDGFAWGGIGVAAVWYGGAVGVARRLLRQARDRDARPGGAGPPRARSTPRWHAARTALRDAAAASTTATADGADGALLALRVRQVVADAAETRPAPRRARARARPARAGAPTTPARVADLRLYLRQHHAERDLAAPRGRCVARRPRRRVRLVTPSFTHDGPGTGRGARGVARRLGAGPRARRWPTTAACTRLVVVAAHPDDETLGAGGLIAARPTPTSRSYVVLPPTARQSHPDSPTTTRDAPGQLGGSAEAEAALGVLAPAAPLVFLGAADGAGRRTSRPT